MFEINGSINLKSQDKQLKFTGLIQVRDKIKFCVFSSGKLPKNKLICEHYYKAQEHLYLWEITTFSLLPSVFAMAIFVSEKLK